MSTNQPSERLIVIGGVAAGMSAAAKARRSNPGLAITVYEQSGYVSYGACGLPYAIKGEIARVEDVVVRTPEQFAKQGISALVRHEVLAITPDARAVTVRNLESGAVFEDHYDKLLLTTGGAASRIPIPGADMPGVFTLRTVEDGLAIKAWLDELRPARGVIIGGGYIGLELAEALAAHGVALTVVERLPQLQPSLDIEMASHVQAELERQGVDVRLEHGVEAISGDDRVREVTAGGVRFPAEIVIMAAGVRPSVGLASAAGIALGPTGAVAVDDHQRTNLPGIWSAGDVAEAHHLVTGRPAWVPLGTTANKQGKVAGTNIAGGDARFGGIVGTSVVKVFDLTAASSGLSEERARAEGFSVKTVSATAGSRAHYMPGGHPIHVKLVYEAGSGRMLGGQLVGREGVAQRVDVIAAALHAGWTVEQLGELDLAYAPPFSPVWDPILVAANLARQ
ncbi:FAD-dependent oxidoreductase [Oscillochloris sp. ZM17-4]|uniref:FAD-dependent oxidoreductase n=1 Tax=Oscillochloris sp. ZM17-4 TaxID=2866714 RepID=UPI001C72BF2C|nr:FAD-dependent oxidoreductase [Oscillochloris sp. ZM17-4]MBX0330716.1 FAD-dependent oxidoreductase [Oscillochloris sp. ZM17-4]